MKCPECSHKNTRVLETRDFRDRETRRKRHCLQCNCKFNTIETIYTHFPQIVKKDGMTESFDKEKLRKGIQLACLKRPVSLSQIEDIVSKIAKSIMAKRTKSLSANELGQIVIKELKSLDDVAYIRFASVYNEFKNVNEFVESLKTDYSGMSKNIKH